MSALTAIDRAVARWTNPTTRPLFKGKLIDRDTGCMCAQGDVLFNEGGISADELFAMAQSEADKRTMDLLGISRAHSVLLRTVNDRRDGQPQNVLTDPASVLGEFAPTILAFWLHLDRMIWDQWAAQFPYDAAYAAYAYAAYADAAYADDTAYRGRRASRGATLEIIGQEVLRERGLSFQFLPMFGFNSPADIPV